MPREEHVRCLNLEIGYQKSITKPLNFSVGGSQVTIIRGENACGKTTLIRTLLGDIKPISGSVLWKTDADSTSYLPQIAHYDSHFSYTAQEILDVYEVPPLYKEFISRNLLQKRWIDMSGGERKLLMFLSRLTTNLKTLILDEPFNHMDQSSIQKMIDILNMLISGPSKIAVILISHIEIDLGHQDFKMIELSS